MFSWQLFWKIVAIILIIIVLSLTIFKNFLINTYGLISVVNTNFFTQTPSWVNYLIWACVISLLIAFANSFRN